MYDLKKIGKVVTNKFVGTGPSFYKKKNLPGRGLTEVEKYFTRLLVLRNFQYSNVLV
jgi:hypothetical protein